MVPVDDARGRVHSASEDALGSGPGNGSFIPPSEAVGDTHLNGNSGSGVVDVGASTGHERQSSACELSETKRTPYLHNSVSDTRSAEVQRPRVERPRIVPRATEVASSAADKPRSSERVFPMSSVVATDADSVNGLQGADTTAALKQSEDTEVHPISLRFEHMETEEGHMIVTGRAEGIQRCEDEPIHMPGAVQQFGVLIAVEAAESGDLVVRQVSENSTQILGLTPSYLFKLKSFTEVLSPDQANILHENIDLAREDAEEEDADSDQGLQIFALSGWGTDDTRLVDGSRGWRCWCAVHVLPTNRGLIIIELEAQKDLLYPLCDPFTKDTGPTERMGLSGDVQEPTQEELHESTHQESKPLKALAKLRKSAATSSMDLFSVLGQINEQFAAAPDLPSFLKIAVGCVKELTGFHRVMVYQFDEHWNGQVVTELVDWRATKDLYRGLNFPATDIPAQAREMYKRNKVRLLYDRDQPTARLVCCSQAELNRPLDLTFAYLRAMSPIHIKYLRNMSVRASMSISIIAFGQLWGLISCHSYGHHGTRVSFPVRKMCRLLGETISRNIERLSYAARLHSKKLINTVSTPENPGGYIIAKAEDLLTLFDADFGVLSIGDEGRLLGQTENSTEVIAAMQYFRVKQYTQITFTSDLHRDLPEISKRLGDVQSFSGLLLVPLSSQGRDFIVFFRRGHLKQVHWAGNPYEKVMKAGTKAYLEPRKSFKIWSETVVGKTRQWTDEQVETAAVLCLVYGKFIDVWRQKEAALKSSQMTNLLLSNASHEVRTPLNAIINYLELALDGRLDSDTRENLKKSHQASKSLIYVINDLLDLTRHEVGNRLLNSETFHFIQTIQDACVIYRTDAERKGLCFEIVMEDDLPSEVIGDERVLRQIVTNTVSNALKHTEEGGITIEIRALDQSAEQVKLSVSISDTGCGIPTPKLDKLFRVFEDFTTLDDQDEAPAAGLGLAIVARAVRTSKGQMRVESEVGKGTTFKFEVEFLLPPKEAQISSPVTIQSSKMLEDYRSKMSHPFSMTPRRNSSSSVNSHSTVSEIDSLVDALAQNRLSNEAKMKAPTNNTLSPKIPGQVPVEGSQIPLRSVRIDPLLASETVPTSSIAGVAESQTVQKHSLPAASAESSRSHVATVKAKSITKITMPSAGEKFDILVVEDDPVNRMIMQRRLKKDGHTVTLTVHGEDAHQTIRMRRAFDVILMDIQMPICDGWESARRIRAYESSLVEATTDQFGGLANANTRGLGVTTVSQEPPSASFLAKAFPGPDQRIPIIAVSASLTESQRFKILASGMDGWILKPVDFSRLGQLFRGIRDPDQRRANAYQPGPQAWEKGGWLRV